MNQSIIDAAWNNLPEDLKARFIGSEKNITEFHSREIEQGFVDMDTPGITSWSKVTPLARVGLYVQVGTAGISIYHYDDCIAGKIAGG